ncbi:hypothetical protein DSM3645_10827 [Blastopirellula marina DSM 3645]|uniref:Carboxypeptidase regulatory-like domain-containing protein n=2 Tax=Blastopirellula marina TaxID=124 RepID=A3ZSR1_9BACT|nr:hypothetical protein DSM3645_10827 [Blastopirellula marina DSM 3645]
MIGVGFVILAGCGERGEIIVPVSGTVRLDGAPMAAGEVGFITFQPRAGRAAIGKIDPSNGAFTLSTNEAGDGVLVGEHEVTVSVNATGAGGNPISLIPKKYQEFATSGLNVTIDGPTDSLIIELEGPLKRHVKTYDPAALGDDPGF